MLLDISHTTTYSYRPAVDRAQHVAYLRPHHTAQQELLDHHLDITPAPERVQHNTDAFGNSRMQWEHSQAHALLRIHAQMRVRTSDAITPLPSAQAMLSGVQMQSALLDARSALLERRRHPLRGAQLFCEASPFVPSLKDDGPFSRELMAYAQTSLAHQRPLAEGIVELMERLHKDFLYRPQSTDVNTPLHQVWEQRSGVCQDFAHLFLTLLRLQGLAARYVSGYILSSAQEKDPQIARAQDTAMRGADASHAWLEVCLGSAPEAPDTLLWLALDPTNCRSGLHTPGPEFVKLACGRDYGDVAPVSGQIFSNRPRGQETQPVAQELGVQVTVQAV